MFWAFKLSLVVDIWAFLALRLFGLLFEKLGIFFSNLLVTLIEIKFEWFSIGLQNQAALFERVHPP